jgi:hypothetical protein
MARAYGKFPDRRPRRKSAANAHASVKNLRVRINGRYDLEDLSMLLQRALARLEDTGVVAVDRCALYLTPLNRTGDQVAIRDEKGRIVESIELSQPVSARFTKASR